MRPFRSRVTAAIVFAVLLLGLLGNVASADDWTPSQTTCFPEDPWPTLETTTSFPEDPWPTAE